MIQVHYPPGIPNSSENNLIVFSFGEIRECKRRERSIIGRIWVDEPKGHAQRPAKMYFGHKQVLSEVQLDLDLDW